VELKIKTLHDGSEVSLNEIVSKHPNIKYRVGCDSLNIKDKTVFITTLVGIHPEKKGAFILYSKEKIPRIDEPQVRLWMEVEKAIEFSVFLRDEHFVEIDCIDFDLNPDVTYESSRLVASAIGYAESMGFKAYCKPDSIFAIYAADFIVHKGNDGTKRKGLNT
jgi:predicted RNase H-related nuclease YkuK (DUF458 family)